MNKKVQFEVKKYASVKAAKGLFDEAKDWPKKGPQEYGTLKACDIFFRYLRLKNRVTVYGIYDDTKLVAIMPIRMMTDGSAQIAGSFERLDYVDFIYRPKARVPEIVEFFMDYLKKEIGVKKFYTRFVDEKSPTYKALSKMKGFKLEETWENVNIDITEPNWDEFFAKLSKHAKQNLRTAYNRAERDGKKIELVCYSGSTRKIKDKRAKKDINDCLDLYIKRQQSTYVEERARSYAFRTKMFHYVSVCAKTNDRTFFAILKMDGKVAAFMQGFYNPFDKEYEIPRLAMNDEMKFYSPGMILVAEVIKKYIGDENVTHINLLRGNEPYKFAMGGEVYYTKNFEIKL